LEGVFSCDEVRLRTTGLNGPAAPRMSEKIENVKALIESLTPAELSSLASYLRSKLPTHPLEQKWGISHELILDAIYRSQDLVQRGVRGVVAEAVFEATVLPRVDGWKAVQVVGDLPYDFRIQRNSDGREITIQVKLQRTEKGLPLSRKIFGPGTFIVEVQKTRTGTKRRRKAGNSVPRDAVSEKTRPYQFGDFDIIAVNMQPSSHDWMRFMYTVGSWLLPRAGNKRLIEVMQPVHGNRSGLWTDDVSECIEWFLSGQKKLIFDRKPTRPKRLSRHRSRNTRRN